MIRLTASDEDLARAAELLEHGELVAVPTETVYGLAADASNPDAVRRIFAAKRRPADHPLIVHLPGMESMTDWAEDIPYSARRLAAAFWPGPLTLILKKKGTVADVVTGGQDTVGLRVPGHPVALKLLQRLGRGIAAPSANRFGHISPTTADHVVSEFENDNAVAAVIDGGPCHVGVESTIVDCTGPEPRILRPGMIGTERLAMVLGSRPEMAGEKEGPRASGRLASHYAPTTRLELIECDALSRPDSQAAVLALTSTPDPGGFKVWTTLPADPVAYARGLYAALRELDRCGAERILVQRPPATAAWAAVRDRLERAAA
ncbi:threonylcarbamoyl-AMP synthase [Wenzhouxiangella sp. AB-CW3]|uniref:L-threonylcarbamoyladenylate synthase n=1 Tax=Wenzhouxiangella sp. AB-CW3 TaxID=2771012 RepID=UPI00168AE76F|nr:L-threonylcarbamoyladenylate synthase [Wenzhouxiangella sp. AB-CW3]QOC23186.1 threonylcarbamoyl-AMP synthase [Wenzhouxiangella sp. AB-CW3]